MPPWPAPAPGERVAPARRSSRPAPPAPRKASLSYLPGLDGLRAISVMAVLLYHADLPWIRGGFLGVEVFFVISGYLITLLLLIEKERTDTISLKAFYVRRARRLLPALYALLVAVVVVWTLFVQEQVGRLRQEVMAALFYVTNWWLIASQTSYFENLGRPSPLRHLWSLAVEEQFYLLWPALFVGLLGLLHRKVERLALAILGLAVASSVLMAVLYTPGTDPSRVYYGTDTRAAGLLLGALLALFWRPSAVARGPIRNRARRFDVLGFVAVVVLLVFFWQANATSSFLYYGGFFLLSTITLVAIMGATHPYGVLGHRLLGNPLMRYVGTRSYGLYLWHWPVFILLRPGLETDWGVYQTLAVRLAITFALTELSYRLIEMPIRMGGLGRWFKSLGGPATPRRHGRRLTTALVAGIAVLTLAPVAVVMAQTKDEPDEIAASLRAGQDVLAGVTTTVAGGPAGSAALPTTVAPPVTTPVATTLPAATTVPGATSVPGVTAPVATTVPPTVAPAVPAISAIGDSVMLGAAPVLLETFGPGSTVDAVVGRNFKQAVPIVAQLKAAGQLQDVVVVHLGNNGGTSAATVEKLLTELADRKKVIVLGVKLPRSWEGPTNDTLREVVPKFPNAVLVDWKAASAGQDGLFYKDGIHLRPAGARFYAALVKQQL